MEKREQIQRVGRRGGQNKIPMPKMPRTMPGTGAAGRHMKPKQMKQHAAVPSARKRARKY